MPNPAPNGALARREEPMNKLLLTPLAILAFGIASADTVQVSKSSVVGTWLLNGSDKNTRFLFRKDGTFHFVATNCSSKGQWSVDGSSLKFVWTHVDDQKVAPGKVKGSFPINQAGELEINKFRYRKAQ